jgi:hypothetical protein
VCEEKPQVSTRFFFVNFSVAIKIVLAPHFSIGVFIPKSVFNIYTQHTERRVSSGKSWPDLLGPVEKVLFPGKEQ